jgi:hypothetical protein
MRRFRVQFLVLLLCILGQTAFSQSDSTPRVKPDTTKPMGIDSLVEKVDTALRILNLNPYITLHVDSTLNYKLDINRENREYFWFLKNAPLGLKINKDNGILTFKAEKSFFLSGKLKYDYDYRVSLGVQSTLNPKERVDTSFTLVFYSTDIIPSLVKPTVGSMLTVDEGDTVSFQIQCDNGSFPIERVGFFSSLPLKPLTTIHGCDDTFTWVPSYDFVKETDSGKAKVVLLNFVGSTKFMVRDTATIKVVVRNALNYPYAVQEHAAIAKSISTYVLQLKFVFLQLDKSVKKNKGARTTFDVTSATTAMTGTVLATSSTAGTSAANMGKILPTVGVTLVPVKEAVSPTKTYDQNQASLVRGAIKRLEYMLRDNALIGERDPDIVKKTSKLRDELQAAQVQLVDIPIEIVNGISEEELNEYFNSPAVNKKYRLSNKKSKK